MHHNNILNLFLLSDIPQPYKRHMAVNIYDPAFNKTMLLYQHQQIKSESLVRLKI